MSTLWGPPHSTFFAHAGVADVINAALCPGRRNCEAIPVSMAIVYERVEVVRKVGIKFVAPGFDALGRFS
jgi:hypothetical protein